MLKSKAEKKWLSEATKYNPNDYDYGFAGIFGKAVTGLRVSGGKAYMVHTLGGTWLPAVTGNDEKNDNNGYAGTVRGDAIDAVAISGGVRYAVHTLEDGWLPSVTGYNTKDDYNGYAGILGHTIDAVMISGRKYATSYGSNGGSIIYPPVVDYGNLTEGERVKIIYDYLKSYLPGTTKNGVAAVLGCWYIESGLQSKCAEGEYYDPPVGTASNRNSPSYDDNNWLSMNGNQIYGYYPSIYRRGLGLGQWTDTQYGNRNTLLRNYANKKGKKWYDMTLQLEFMLNGDDSSAIYYAKQVLTSSSSINYLTEYFLAKWEGVPGNKLEDRQSQADRKSVV